MGECKEHPEGSASYVVSANIPRTQYTLIKEYTLNYRGLIFMIEGRFFN